MSSHYKIDKILYKMCLVTDTSYLDVLKPKLESLDCDLLENIVCCRVPSMLNIICVKYNKDYIMLELDKPYCFATNGIDVDSSSDMCIGTVGDVTVIVNWDTFIVIANGEVLNLMGVFDYVKDISIVKRSFILNGVQTGTWNYRRVYRFR